MMKLQRLLVATLVLGIVWNAYDFLVQGVLLRNLYASLSFFRQDAPLVWLIVGDFVGALVFIWVYDRVYDSFGGGAGGGAKYGMYAGVLTSFPTWLFMSALIVGWPYALSWLWVTNGIIFAVLGGAVAGAVYRKAPAI
jgi:hypothetical protein